MNRIYNSRRFSLLLFCLITLLIYSNAVNAPFYLDDEISIIENYHVHITDLSIESLQEAAFSSPLKNRPLPSTRVF